MKEMGLKKGLSRREFLGSAGTGAMALLMPSTLLRKAFQGSTHTVVPFSLTLAPGQAQILPGALTDVWRFTGQGQKGSSNALQYIANSYLGPTIRLEKGQTVLASINNQLTEDTVVHWHGLHVPAAADGHPSQAVLPGSSYKVSFPVINRAGTYWYHPHPDMKTGGQVYKGLAGMIIVSDAEEKALALPRGQFDLPIVIQDRVCDLNNQWSYVQNPQVGTLGNKILVNGQYLYVQSVSTRAYRLRILNGSNARVYKLAWSDGGPMMVIGSDGGLLASPSSKSYLTLAPGERAEVWRQFTGANGTQITLQSLAFTGVGSGGGSGLAQGATFDVMNFRIDSQQTETLEPPATLSNLGFENPTSAINYNNPRSFAISQVSGKYVLNGEEFYMNLVASNEEVQLNTLEVWEFTNTATGTLVGHPIHLHGRQFQIISRTVDPNRLSNWQTVSGGFTDEGWKDTFLIMPGETVRILVRFARYPGIFLYHCHVLEHEDMGMMRNFRVNP